MTLPASCRALRASLPAAPARRRWSPAARHADTMHLRSAFASMFVTILACAAARRPCTAWLVHAAAVHGPAPPLVRLGQQSGAARRTGADRWVPGPPSRPVINWQCMGLFTRVCVMFSLSEADAGSGPDHSSAADHLSDVIPLSSDVTGGGSGRRPQKRRARDRSGCRLHHSPGPADWCPGGCIVHVQCVILAL